MNYQDAWQYLDNLQFFKIKLGLDSMQRFLKRCGSPEKKLKCIHVGGTNGKGSVSVSLLEILKQAGYKVGLYTSPHLSSVRERFRINDNYIDKNKFAEIASHIIEILGDDQITYFEFTTSLAFLWFAEMDVDIAVIEVGLGGRLDATNVITPLVSVITNVSMDHEAHLGNTISEVAFEKAGIIKPGIPLISGVSDPVAKKVINDRAMQLGSPVYNIDQNFFITKEPHSAWKYSGIINESQIVIDNLKPGLTGDYQADNLAVAISALKLLKPHGFIAEQDILYKAVENTRWPGRLESFSLPDESGNIYRYLLDGAHNPAGISALIQTIENDFVYKKLILVWASMADKDIRKCLYPILPFCSKVIFTRPDEIRSATTEMLRDLLNKENSEKCLMSTSVKEALKIARSNADNDDLICVAGSLYLIGKARQILLGDIA